jgi:amino acid permease
MTEPTFSRESLLAGSPSRRATTLRFAIEGRTARLALATRTAMARYPVPERDDEREHAYLGALADARSELAVRPQDLERYASRWAPLVPRDPDTTAALAAAILDKYAFRRRDAARLTAALRLADPAVERAFQRSQGQPVATAFVPRVSMRERLRWWRSEFEIRLESLPPTVTAFALTLTETIGVGILALPIAFAAAGPLAALAFLAVFGVINILTVAGLVESITRSGSMRYGSTYLGQFVGQYFGRSGNATISLALLLLNIIGLGVLILGFGTTAASITGWSAVLWAAVLAVAILLILRRESLDATVASVLVVGSINIALLVATMALSTSAFDTANFSPGLDLRSVEVGGILGLLFGTALMAFFGHTSAVNAAKVVLARDPNGRSLLWGNVLAIGVALVLNLLFVLTVLAAVPAEELIGFDGTALTPLVAATGPAVATIGLVFVALSMGLSSLHMSLSLYNQVGERLPRPGGDSRSGTSGLLADARVRTLLKVSPVVALLVVVELMLISGTGSFTDSVNFVGTITLPLIAGLFPMMLLVATRRRGEYLPRPTTGVLGHPVVAGGIALFFFAALLLHAFVIWSAPLQQAAALVAAAAMVWVVSRSLREGAFGRRTVVELRVDATGPDQASASVVAAGARAGAGLSWRDGTGTHAGQDAAILGHAGSLERLEVTLPERAPRSVRVWVHRVDEEGVSAAWPAVVEVRDGDGRYPLQADQDGVADHEVAAAAATIVISTPASGGTAHA